MRMNRLQEERGASLHQQMSHSDQEYAGAEQQEQEEHRAYIDPNDPAPHSRSSLLLHCQAADSLLQTNCPKNLISPAKSDPISPIPYFIIAIRSTPIPKAKPEIFFGS